MASPSVAASKLNAKAAKNAERFAVFAFRLQRFEPRVVWYVCDRYAVKTFWAERFGTVVDRFGVQWMINCGGSDQPV